MWYRSICTEKGGSGLVFYTDAVFWDALKGDWEEREADDFFLENDTMNEWTEVGATDTPMSSFARYAQCLSSCDKRIRIEVSILHVRGHLQLCIRIYCSRQDIHLSDEEEKDDADRVQRHIHPCSSHPDSYKKRHPVRSHRFFERHSRGIGSKLLKQYGWQSGTGLGRNEDGLVRPLIVKVGILVKKNDKSILVFGY